MSRYLFILVFILAAGNGNVSAQQMPDSVVRKLAGLAQDSNYVNKLNQFAYDYLRTNPDITRTIASQALDLAPKIRFTRGYARALTIMGNSYWYEGIYEFAQNYYLLAARQYQTIQDSIGLGHTYNNIGEVYKKLNENDKALVYLLRSKELHTKDSVSNALTLYNIGELYIRMGKTDEARKYLQQSFVWARRFNLKRVIAFNYWGQGELREIDRKYEEALQFYFDSEKIWLELGETRSLIQTYQEVADIYRQQRKFSEAEKYLLNAMHLATKIQVADLQVNNFLRFSRLDSVRGNYQRSLYFLTRHNSLKDSVYNLLKAEQIARLQTIYETETREQENQQLRIDKELKNSELQTQRITLIAISVGLLLAGIFAWMINRQRKKIALQKDAIEMQAVALLKLNEELQELNKNLEARISERTSQLTVQNQRLTEYTFINAHKLRAPVASILGLINLLQQVKPEERDAILVHLKTCSDQLDAIIREISRNLEGAIVPDQH